MQENQYTRRIPTWTQGELAKLHIVPNLRSVFFHTVQLWQLSMLNNCGIESQFKEQLVVMCLLFHYLGENFSKGSRKIMEVDGLPVQFSKNVPDKFNSTTATHLSKGAIDLPASTVIKNWPPVALLSTVFKSFSKSLAN